LGQKKKGGSNREEGERSLFFRTLEKRVENWRSGRSEEKGGVILRSVIGSVKKRPNGEFSGKKKRSRIGEEGWGHENISLGDGTSS